MDPGYSVGQRAIFKPSDLGAPAHRHHCRRNRFCFFVGCRISVNLGREHSSMQASDDEHMQQGQEPGCPHRVAAIDGQQET